MVRHIVSMVILCFSLMTLTCPTGGITLTLDDELQELTENYGLFKRVVQKKNVELEERVRRLEDQLRRKKEIERNLKSHVIRLESKLKEEESRLAALNPWPLAIRDLMKSISSNSDTQLVGVQNEMPTSCADLRQTGHVLRGFYSVMRDGMVENVYCNFTKVPDSADFQQRIGYGNVTSSPVYFYAQRTTPIAEESTPISFNVVRTNAVRAMNNETSGKFTAPQKGAYFFIFNGMAKFPASSSPLHIGLALRLNDELTAGRVEEVTDDNFTDNITPLALQVTLTLESGDEVWIEISFLSPGVSLYNDNTHFTSFSGWLLEEEIAGSL